jgi:uroporphyrinogen-III decarboxylase
MTSRQRLLSALNGQTPDRVPVTLFILDSGHFIHQVYPDVDSQDFDALQLKVIEIQKQLGVDVFVRLLHGIYDPISVRLAGLNVTWQTDNWEVRTEQARHGNTRVQRSTIRTPGGTLTQDFSTTEVNPGTLVHACTKKAIECPADLEIAIRYEPRMPESVKARVRERVQRIRRAAGDDGIVGVWSPNGPFNNASLLVEAGTLYSLFLTDYPFYERLMNFARERWEDYASAIDAAGVDVHCVGGNVPGGFLGRRNYDRYVLPFEREHIAFLQRSGTPAMYHNCGQIMQLVESYVELGARAVEPFSPPPLGDADLERAKKVVNGRYAMVSGIDQVNVLQNGNPETVRRATERAIRAGKPGGGFILQPVDFLEYGTPLENVRAFVETAMENASY